MKGKRSKAFAEWRVLDRAGNNPARAGSLDHGAYTMRRKQRMPRIKRWGGPLRENITRPFIRRIRCFRPIEYTKFEEPGRAGVAPQTLPDAP